MSIVNAWSFSNEKWFISEIATLLGSLTTYIPAIVTSDDVNGLLSREPYAEWVLRNLTFLDFIISL